MAEIASKENEKELQLSFPGTLELRSQSNSTSIQLPGSVFVATKYTCHVQIYKCVDWTHLGELEKCPRLKSFDLTCHAVDIDKNLRVIGRLTELERIRVKADLLTGKGLKYLRNLKNLREIEIRSEKLCDSSLKYLKRHTGLESIIIVADLLTGRGLKYLRNIKNLKEIEIRSEKLCDSNLEHLKHHINLEAIVLDDCLKITGVGLKYIKNLPGLRELSLGFCEALTDEGLHYLYQFRNLSHLNLDEAGVDLSDDALEKLKSALPDCQIYWPDQHMAFYLAGLYARYDRLGIPRDEL